MEKRTLLHNELESFVHACDICKGPAVTGKAGLVGLIIAQTAICPCKGFCEG